jgi:acyl carrier protein
MVLEKVIGALASQLEIDPATITRDSNIIEDFGADSLDIVELLTYLENEYNLVVTDESAHDFKTVGDVADFIESLIKK